MSDEFTREYSKRLGVLTGAQLQRALDHFDLGKLVATEDIAVGLFGQNLFLDSDRGRYVLRACPHGREQFPREQFFANLLKERTTVPAPWPYRHEPDPTIFSYAFAIMPRMPGECLPKDNRLERLPPAEWHQIATALGSTLAQMHALTWTMPGQFDFDTHTIKPLLPTDDPLPQLREKQQKLTGLPSPPTADDLHQIEATIRAAEPALQLPFTPTYVHHDYREGNTTLTQSDHNWRVTGVFDLMEGYFRRPEEDFARYICSHAKDRPALIKAFLDGYRATRPLTEGWMERTRLFALIDQLLLWIYGQENGWHGPEAKLATALMPVLTVPLI